MSLAVIVFLRDFIDEPLQQGNLKPYLLILPEEPEEGGKRRGQTLPFDIS